MNVRRVFRMLAGVGLAVTAAIGACTASNGPDWTLMHVLAGRTDPVPAIAFSPDGCTLAASLDNNAIKLWDVATGMEKRSLVGHMDTITALAFSSDGRTLASSAGINDCTIILWDVAKAEKVRAVSLEYSLAISGNSLAFSPDGETLALGLLRSGIRLLDVATGQVIEDVSGYTEILDVMEYSPNGTRLASGTRGGEVRLWDATSGLRTLWIGRQEDAVRSVAFSPDGDTLAAGLGDGTVRLWDVASGEELLTMTEHSDAVRSIAFHSNGETLSTGSLDGTVKVWDVASLEEVSIFTGDGETVKFASLGPDGVSLAVATVDDGISLWERSVRPSILSIKGPEGHIMRGIPFHLEVSFRDPNRDVELARHSATPAGKCKLLRGPALGDLSGVPDGAFQMEFEAQDEGAYQVQVVLVDSTGLASDPEPYGFTVIAPTEPTILDVRYQEFIAVRKSYEVSCLFRDSEGDITEAQLRVVGGDGSVIEIDGGFILHPVEGAWIFSSESEGDLRDELFFTVQASEVGTFKLELTLIDAVGLKDSRQFTFTVEDGVDEKG